MRAVAPRQRPGGALLAAFLAVVALGPAGVAADSDVGDVAVVETDPTILQPGELFDLAGRTLTFTPRAGGGYTVGVSLVAFDSQLGAQIPLGDDDAAQQPLGFVFPFFGQNRSTVFINSNGHLTFISGSALTHFNPGGTVTSLGNDLSNVLNRLAASAPRIAVLWQDWNPAAGGGVFASTRPDRLVVTWNQVPLFGTAITATFQAVLFNTGVIQLHYQSVTTTPGGGYLVGLSPGASNQFNVTTIDWSAGPAGSVSRFPNQEPLAQVFGQSASPLIHISAVARRFYRTHADTFDQLVMFANFPSALGNAFAFELTIRQTISGIGLGLFDSSSFWGSAGRLQSFLNMNRLGIYPASPTQTFLGTNTTLDLMGQETGHQWLAFIQFDQGGACSDLLLGRDLAHWSFFKDSDASDMEGNNWQDNGNGTFTSVESTARFSALDQYTMGLRGTPEVPSLFFIQNPSSAGCAVFTPAAGERSCAPRIGVTVSGTRRNVSIQEITTCEGGRWPLGGFSMVNPTTTWRQAFILLVQAGTPVAPADTTKLETIRAAWVPYFNAATEGRGSIDTGLGGASGPPPPPPPAEPIRIISPADGSVFALGVSVTFTWTSVPGAAAYQFEFTGTNLQFANPNGVAPDPVNGLGGAGGGFVVPANALTLAPERPPGVYQVRVLALAPTGAPIGAFSDAVNVFWGLAPPPSPPDRVTITGPPNGSRLQRGGAPVTFVWTQLAGVFSYGFEFTGPGRQFSNPNGTVPDPVNGFGGAGGGFAVVGTGFTTALGFGLPPGVYQARVIGLSPTGLIIGSFSDAVTLIVD
jgi:hypothetical protein